jgi:hypothetical protein
LAHSQFARKAIEIARQLNRDVFMVSRFRANFEAVRDPEAEKQSAEMIDK